jgi:prepilin-type N-terminal cleavage/methylation domain-containing protein
MQDKTNQKTPAYAGFTLLEILIAVTIGSVLVTSLASGLQVFGKELEIVRDEPDARLEEVAVQVTERVRDAWWADVPNAQELRVADPQGNVTTYQLVGDELRVTRPSGVQGTLLADVASASFSVDTTQRLREATPVVADGPWFSKPKPTGPDIEVLLRPGDELALGFHMDDDAPDAVNTVTGVDEERLNATIDRIALTISFLDGSLKEFCHLHATPPHDPEHNDYPGNKLIVELYEGRAPDDGRPYGPALGAIEIPSADLPPTAFVWWDPDLNIEVFPPDAGGPTGSEKCKDEDADGQCDHPGNKHHTNPLDVPDGVAWGWWELHPDIQLITTPGAMEVEVDLSQFGVNIDPGRAYSVVFSVDGWDEVRILATPTFSSAGSGIAFQTGGGSFTPQALGIPMTFSGDQACTQTTATDAVSRVTMDLTLADGRQLSSSSFLQGQVAVADPWRGVVPNQIGDVDP